MTVHKMLAIIAAIVLILCCDIAFSKEASTATARVTEISPVYSALETRPLALPDLAVKSAQVTGSPFTYGGMVIVPLSITITNKGTVNPSGDFNVGAQGWATDGNAYGFDFFVSGEATMEGRGGVLCHGFTGSDKTYQGFLFMRPNPINDPLRAGTRYRIEAMVDYNLDPDSGYYDWGVSDKDRSNNKLVINYP